ncbi:hypothetical protein A7J50_1343 [Pseudomonas antarctica]|uniref:Uncharacterized protein n=1 Tax=Pseudomonas antarctica TaxID=219572 RepID=A0A172YX17_9PSED|nr:hypothetical protein [Pseudomonas antarctica]ANF84777.1 hypothetical protein A7J50_1343 [Pseudomonas antarctica]
MGHSADYQTKLHIEQLEQVVQTLLDQGKKFREGGLGELADTAEDQAAQLKRVIADLRKLMEK